MTTPPQPYVATLIQYVFDPTSHERLNVGAAIECVGLGFVGVRFVGSVQRVARAFPGTDVPALERAMAQVSEGLGRKTLEACLPKSFDSGLVMGEQLRGVTSDPARSLEMIVSRFEGSSR